MPRKTPQPESPTTTLSASDKAYIRAHLEDSIGDLVKAVGRDEADIQAFVDEIVSENAARIPEVFREGRGMKSQNAEKRNELSRVEKAGFAKSDSNDEKRRGIVVSTQVAAERGDDFKKAKRQVKRELIENNPAVYIPYPDDPAY